MHTITPHLSRRDAIKALSAVAMAAFVPIVVPPGRVPRESTEAYRERRVRAAVRDPGSVPLEYFAVLIAPEGRRVWAPPIESAVTRNGTELEFALADRRCDEPVTVCGMELVARGDNRVVHAWHYAPICMVPGDVLSICGVLRITAAAATATASGGSTTPTPHPRRPRRP